MLFSTYPPSIHPSIHLSTYPCIYPSLRKYLLLFNYSTNNAVELRALWGGGLVCLSQRKRALITKPQEYWNVLSYDKWQPQMKTTSLWRFSSVQEMPSCLTRSPTFRISPPDILSRKTNKFRCISSKLTGECDENQAMRWRYPTGPTPSPEIVIILMILGGGESWW